MAVIVTPLLEKARKALRLTSEALDDEIVDLIAAGKKDLQLVGIRTDEGDPLIIRAVLTYVRANFGSPPDYERLKASYDEQKAQMQYASGYGLRKDDCDE